MSAALQIHGLCAEEVEAAARLAMPRGHGPARRIYRQAMLEGRFAPEEHGVNPQAVGAWRGAFRFGLPAVQRCIEEPFPGGSEEDITAKAVLRLHDGLECECVRIPMGRGRHTLCMSSQVGCRMGCRFCETGRMGLLRHLSADEIVAQWLVARHVLRWPVQKIVFMGMGEALDNWDNLIQALRVLTDRPGLAIGQERITVCTVGHGDGIRRLAAAGFKRLNLSVSLNAATDAQRVRIMPVTRDTALAELQALLADYRSGRHFVLGVNYCLMPGINDAREDARNVAAFVQPLGRCMVNVIPYNPGTQPLTRAPEEDEIVRFVSWLREDGCAVRRRITKGRSVMAACGQLGNVALRREVQRSRAAQRSEATASQTPASQS